MKRSLTNFFTKDHKLLEFVIKGMSKQASEKVKNNVREKDSVKVSKKEIEQDLAVLSETLETMKRSSPKH